MAALPVFRYHAPIFYQHIFQYANKEYNECVCVYVCVCVREREERDKDIKRESVMDIHLNFFFFNFCHLF
jgi:hypothetical protein